MQPMSCVRGEMLKKLVNIVSAAMRLRAFKQKETIMYKGQMPCSQHRFQTAVLTLFTIAQLVSLLNDSLPC